MRESLTVLAILLIVVLTTALVGPYFVDWNAHRGEIEQRLSTLLGADVAIRGPVDVKLLPRPIFHLQDVAVHGRGPDAGDAKVSRLDMELSLTSLLRGAIEFVDADVSAPVVTIPVDADGALRLPEITAENANRISLVHIVVRDGTLVLRRPDGQPSFTGTGIAAEGEATSLAGPFKFSAHLDTPGGPLALQVATGVIESGRMRLKAGVQASAGVPKTDIDGILLAGEAAGAARLSFNGAMTTGGAIPFGSSTSAVVPWRVTATVHAEPGQAAITAGELRAGADGRALIATLAGDISGHGGASGRLTLRARQIDAGRLAVPPDLVGEQGNTLIPGKNQAAPAPTSLADVVAALGDFAGNGELTAALPFPLKLDMSADTLTAGSLTLTDLTGSAALATGQPISGKLALGGPDGARLQLDGAFEPGAAAVFKGRVDALAPRLQHLLDGLAPELPAAARLRDVLPFDSVTAAGALDLSGVGFAAHDVVLALDRSKFAGTVTLTRGVGTDRARLFADLTSDALDLDALPDWGEATRAASDLDVSFSLVAHALRLASGDAGSVNAGRIALQLTKSGSAVTLDRLSLADVGGATAEIKGRSDGRKAHAEGRIDARRLRDVLRLVDRLAPGAMTDQLVKSSDALSPALMSVTADALIGTDGAVTPTLVTLDGTAAATKVAFTLRPTESGSPSQSQGDALPFTLRLKLDAPDAGTLLRQVGITTAASTAVGRGRIDLEVDRDRTGASSGTFEADLGDTTVKANGHGAADGKASGQASIKGSNVAPLARALLLAVPEPGAQWAIDATGQLGYGDNRITAQGVMGHVLGTGFKADLSYVIPAAGSAGGPPPLSGTLALDRLPLPTLAALVLGPPAPPKPGAVFSDTAFGPALVSLPRGELALSATAVPLIGPMGLQGMRATLRLAPQVLTLDGFSAALGAGRVGGSATLRRDGASASLATHLEWSNLPLATPSLGGLAGGSLDLAGTGNSVAATIASLGGAGTLAVDGLRLPRFDPGALSRVIAKADGATSTIDDDAIAQDLGQQLDHGALALGDVTTPVTVAAGTIRAPAITTTSAGIRTEASGSLDLASLLFSLRTTATMLALPKDWVGAPPQVTVIWRGPFASPAREVDAANLANGIAARAIARDQARIEAFQDDIRERAFFARRLRAIEAEQQASRDKAKAEADAARQLQSTLPEPPKPPPPSIPTPTPVRRPLGAPGKPLDLH